MLWLVVIVIIFVFLLCEKQNENFKAFAQKGGGRWVKGLTTDVLINTPPTPDVLSSNKFVKKTNDGKGFYFSSMPGPVSVIKIGNEVDESNDCNKITFFRNSFMPPENQKIYDATQMMAFGNLDGNMMMSPLLQKTDSNSIHCNKKTFGIAENDNQFTNQKNSCYFISK